MDYERMKPIIPVCTNNEAREYFAGKGLTYADITDGDILALVMMLNQELKKSVMNKETSMGRMTLSRKMDIKTIRGELIYCFLYVNSHYFNQREAISFNKDGFIGFAGWADQGNVNPILRAFLRWCDYMAESKEALTNDD